jgi:hypothetical protein
MNTASLIQQIPAERIRADEKLRELYLALKKVFEDNPTPSSKGVGTK